MRENDHNPPARLEKTNGITQQPQQTLKIGALNVRSLATTNRFIEVTYMLQNIKIDILGLSEVR